MTEAEIIPTPAGGPRYFSIVVAGVMTPTMHHPYWYLLIGCLTRIEADSAVRMTSMIPEFARFQTSPEGGIRVTCTPDKWEIAVWNEEERPRILEIACKVFEKLNETPVREYAFFSLADLDTKVPSANEVLVGLAAATSLGFENGGERKCVFRFLNFYSDHAANVMVKNSDVHDSKVWVSYSTQHLVKQVPGYHDLTPDLKRDFDPHWEAAKAMWIRVVARINGEKGVANGI